MLHEESQPFGRLAQLRWKITHIYNQDILLAASVLCLYLQDVDKFESLEILQRTAWTPRAEEIRKSLTVSHGIWLETSKTSAEAGKVAKALRVVLGLELKSAEVGEQLASHEYVADFDLPVDGFETTFNDPCEPMSACSLAATNATTNRSASGLLFPSHVLRQCPRILSYMMVNLSDAIPEWK